MKIMHLNVLKLKMLQFVFNIYNFEQKYVESVLYTYLLEYFTRINSIILLKIRHVEVNVFTPYTTSSNKSASVPWWIFLLSSYVCTPYFLRNSHKNLLAMETNSPVVAV